MTAKRKVNHAVKTQAYAYHVGFQDALAFLVDVLIEGGTVDHMMDVLEDNASDETRAKLLAHYGSKRRSN